MRRKPLSPAEAFPHTVGIYVEILQAIKKIIVLSGISELKTEWRRAKDRNRLKRKREESLSLVREGLRYARKTFKLSASAIERDSGVSAERIRKLAKLLKKESPKAATHRRRGVMKKPARRSRVV